MLSATAQTYASQGRIFDGDLTPRPSPIFTLPFRLRDWSSQDDLFCVFAFVCVIFRSCPWLILVWIFAVSTTVVYWMDNIFTLIAFVLVVLSIKVL